MKLLLTSAGFRNSTIVDALKSLINKPLSETKLVYIPTASNVEAGDKWWLVDDYKRCMDLDLKEFDILDFSAVTKDLWLERYSNVDGLIFGGGSSTHLMAEVKKSGLDDELSQILRDKVYIGISAGTHIASKNLYTTKTAPLYGDEYETVNEDKGLGYVDFLAISHANSEYFKNLSFENIKKASNEIDCSVYAIDDESAVVVDGDRIEVVSEGKWKVYKK